MTLGLIEEVALNAGHARERIRDRVINTPVLQSRRFGADLFFKTENFQRSGSFKVRGAMSKLTRLLETNDANSLKLITASSGNHGIGASLAASELGLDMAVVLPINVAQMKLAHIRSLNATAILNGAEAGASEIHAQELSARDGYHYISPYNDPDIIAGQGTIGLELLDWFEDKAIDNIFIAMGGGGLISGIGAAIKYQSPKTKIWGVSARNSAAFDASLKAGRVLETEHKPTLADAVAGGVDADTITLAIARQVVDECLTCSEAEIERALVSLVLDEGMLVEGAAALALAAYEQVAESLKGQTSVVLLCGGNIDRTQAQQLVTASIKSGTG